MSHQGYTESWHKTHRTLSQVLENESKISDKREQRQLLGKLYLHYISIANQLSEYVDQTVQPQKVIIMTKLLEAIIGRVLELKHDLVEVDLNECTHCGDAMEELKLTPEDTYLKIPVCFRDERKDVIEKQNRTIDDVMKKLGYVEKTMEKVRMTLPQAILLIQTHERARQGRLRMQYIKEIRSSRDRSKTTNGVEATKKLQITMAAAIRIQKMWKGYMTRKLTRQRKLEERILIGMVPKCEKENKYLMQSEEICQQRRQSKLIKKKEYDEQLTKYKKELEVTEKELLLEQLTDDVRGWLHDYNTQTGKFPEYNVERGLSRQMSSRAGTDSDLTVDKSTPIFSKEMKKQKSQKSKESKSSEELSQDRRNAVSIFVPIINSIQEEYDQLWKNRDESRNLKQYVYEDIMTKKERLNLEDNLRKVVDEMMESELVLLQEALDKDRGYKSKRTKSGKKVRKSGKKNKKRKEKDLTPDRTTESLFEELVANGIIKKYQSIFLTNFIGEKSSHSPVPYNREDQPPVQAGDIRQLLAEFCILPMLSTKLHENTPHVKSILIAGPTGSGKNMLVHSICTELGAVLFDLTPANIVGKYPGKSGLTMLIHLVLKVARLLQPAVIYTGNAEKPFMKKIPRTDTSDPKRLKKDLPKIVKNFCPEDRIILIGISSSPWEADQKLLQQVYQKLILIPKLDYPSRFYLWQSLLQKYPAINTHFDFTGISRISDGYTAGSIIASTNEVLTVKRTLQLRMKPLSPLELINALSKRIPVYKEEENAFLNWWYRTPLLRRRAQEVDSLKQEEAAEQEIKQTVSKKSK